MNKLKPCPFCGGEARTASKDYGDTHYWRVFCDTPSCAMCMTGVFHSEAEAIAAWNSRAERTCHNANIDRYYKYHFECSECGEHYIVHDCVTRLDVIPNYCPNCGAKVVSE